jgi:hypothetical protein
MNGFLKAVEISIKKSEKIVYLSSFWKPFMWLLAAVGNPFMTALVAFSKISENEKVVS